MAIGERIKRMRNLRKMTQKQLGIMIGFAPNTADVRVAQYETGTRTPKEKYVETIASLLRVEKTALTVPDIDTYLGLYQTLFALEDLYDIKVNKIDDRICLTLETGNHLNDMFSVWHERKEQLENGEITKNKYDDWRYNYPASVAINRDKTTATA
jgi:transcriptional regulator with XRE-family HTH domain